MRTLLTAKGGTSMRTPFEDVIAELDGQIADAKSEKTKKAKAEDLRRKLRNAQGSMDHLRPRIEELRNLGKEPSERILNYCETLEKEITDTARELEDLAVPPPEPLTEEETAEARDFFTEVKSTPIETLPKDEQSCLVRIWAFRWRLMAERMGQERIQHDADMKAAFGAVAGLRDQYYEGSLPALKRDLKRPENWEAHLARARADLEQIRENNRKLDDRRDAVETMLEELEALTYQFASSKGQPELDGKAADVKRFRHLVRETAKAVGMRPKIADICRSFRNALEPEFSFLWRNGESKTEEEAPREKLTNRDVASRIIRRMISNAMIGECHAPIEKVYKGFAGHDQARAKECVKLLIDSGVFKWKRQGKGERISLEAKFVTQSKEFVETDGPFGHKPIDDWCAGG